MIRKSLVKKILIMLLIIFLGMGFYTKSYALGNIINSGGNFIQAGDDVEDTINLDELKSSSNTIYNILLSIAIVVAIIAAMILGIQFMIGSAVDKVKVKEALVPFIVGCIIVFGGFTIWKIVVTVGNNVEEITVAEEEEEHSHSSSKF